jgi:hypothetical protein
MPLTRFSSLASRVLQQGCHSVVASWARRRWRQSSHPCRLPQPETGFAQRAVALRRQQGHLRDQRGLGGDGRQAFNFRRHQQLLFLRSTSSSVDMMCCSSRRLFSGVTVVMIILSFA